MVQEDSGQNLAQSSKELTSREYFALPLEERAKLNLLTPEQTLRLEEIQRQIRAQTKHLD